ncbi:MAG: carbon storage regulator CsrA [Sulfurospirillaceae bacterium]|nr:carbon storage regulator CsrA [Sulfurospirillaceae bacterium]MDD3463807.1 carbon storage regulator CsrA [Sulfurospirillaceae bacterium]
MLVLSRKVGEAIVVDKNITIRVVEISKGVVKIGIDAPKEVLISREELEEAVKAANVEASKHASEELLVDLSKKLTK